MHRLSGLEQEIQQSVHLAELRKLRDSFHGAFHVSADSAGAEAAETINFVHDAFIRRTLEIAEERVRTSYADVPPVSSFAVLLFGSGGRREQTLWSDQDNGLVYEISEGRSPEEAERYVHLLAESFETSMETIGYPPCEGKVLVTNPEWRRTLDQWKGTIETWLDEPEFETVRRLLIMVDGRTVFGDEQLGLALKDALYQGISKHSGTILPRMLQNTLRYKVLVGLLGNLLTEPYGEEAGGIDIKYGAYLPMVNAIRLLALRYNIHATSTLERIEALEGCGGLHRETAQELLRSFHTVLSFRAMTSFQIEDGKYTSSGVLSSKMLTKEVKRELKRTLRAGAGLQRLVKRLIGTEGRRE